MGASPDRTRTRVEPNVPLITTGSILFGASYAASVSVAAVSPYRPDKKLFVPLAGPWLDLADRDDCKEASGCGRERAHRVLLVADGIGQSLGALQILGGFVFPTKRAEPVAKRGVSVKPTWSLSSVGVEARGRF